MVDDSLIAADTDSFGPSLRAVVQPMNHQFAARYMSGTRKMDLMTRLEGR